MQLTNFFKTAIRFIFKNKAFSFINILGLAIGIAASLMIFQYVHYELSYENFHPNKEDVYRIRLDRYSQGELAEEMATACNPLGHALKPIFPEVLEYVVLSDYLLEGMLSYEENNFKIEDGFFASRDFFKVFACPLIAGDSETALAEPNSIVLSSSLARKFFGDIDPMGKIIRFGNRRQLMVTGVFEDLLDNTHLKFDLLISFETMKNTYGNWVEDNWWVDIALTYVLLAPETDPVVFEQKVNDLVKERLGKELTERNQEMKLYLQPIESIHLYSNYPGEAEPNGDGEAVYFLLIISIVILLIAWVNYINLSSARSLERAREVGLRKVNGATRSQLLWQFLVESFVLNIIAAGLAVLIVALFHPTFSRLTGLHVDMTLWHSAWFWLGFFYPSRDGFPAFWHVSGLCPVFL
jgi:putative ABC transport system permease protein